LNEKDKEYIEDHRYYGQVVMFSTQYALCSPYANTTVLRTPDVVQRGLLSAEDHFRGIDYLLNYRLEGSDLGFRAGLSRFYSREAILSSALRPLQEDVESSFPLPKPESMRASFDVIIRERRSERIYSGETITLEELSAILFAAQGVTGALLLAEPEADADRIYVRTQPSGGGMFPITLYIGVCNVEGLETGIYEYYPYSHSLYRHRDFTTDELLLSCDFGDIQPENCAFTLYYMYNVLANANKYGDASFAYAMIETGEIAMNAQLATTALSLGATDLGGYHKQYLEQLLGLDGIYKHIVHMTIFGNVE